MSIVGNWAGSFVLAGVRVDEASGPTGTGQEGGAGGRSGERDKEGSRTLFFAAAVKRSWEIGNRRRRHSLTLAERASERASRPN